MWHYYTCDTKYHIFCNCFHGGVFLLLKPCLEISHFLALFEIFLQSQNVEFNESTHAKRKMSKC